MYQYRNVETKQRFRKKKWKTTRSNANLDDELCFLLPQGTASEATLVALLGAKAKTMKRVKEVHPEWKDAEIVGKLVGYCSGGETK